MELTPQRPPIAQSALSVVLLGPGPAASETAEGLAGWRAYLDSLGRPYELILVRSTRPGEEPNPVLEPARRFEYDPAQGYGAALQDAFGAAQHPLVVLATADRQFQPQDL